MSTLTWVRGHASGTSAASPFILDHNISALAPSQTVRRTIVTFDWWADSTTTQFVDLGVTVNYGVSWGGSNTGPTITPYSDASSTSPRWLYWDQVETRPLEIYDVAGTVYYLVKNGHGSRYIDTRTQYRNGTAASQYLWFGVEPDPTAVANWSNVYWTVSSSVLLETP